MQAAGLCLLRQLRPLAAKDGTILTSCSSQSRVPFLLVNAAQQQFHTCGNTLAAAHDNGFGEWDKKQKVSSDQIFCQIEHDSNRFGIY
jgi:tetrahydromethanopterin S-methyltransferase subunit A